MLAGRYRIVSMLGKGGMGEVYRADDLTLDQPVALKFLPESVATNESALARFRNEVRVARQVSHANVCRVYDLGEVDGHVFLSMEYVDGEDLGSLLRRIGRLPSDKALEISRKLCAGLAAAHEKGVLHRDLKPSNVMLDSRGHVLLTDFGLAGLADELSGAEVRNGTPQYMAPEQLAGREVTARSDIYSLGLVLYEIFTGKRPYEANTMAELIRAQTEATPVSLTSLVRDLDPVVERVVLRCLDPDPSRRPSSALAVAAALPGGDPLAAALAAGETPSPEMVAAAGEGVGLAPRVAILLLACVVLGIAALYALGVRNSALERVGPQYSPEVLAQKARDIIQRAGVQEAPSDAVYEYYWNTAYLNYAQANDKPAPHWSEILKGRPVPLQFWYRESPYPLTADSFHDDLLTPGIVQPDDPPPILSGMIGMKLDADGRLLYFERIPDQQLGPDKGSHPAVDWSALFGAAGLDPKQFQPTEPVWTWLATSDTRVAFTGVWPGTQRPLRVEAASLRGQPVAFSLIGPWTSRDRMPRRSASGAVRGQVILLAVIVVGVSAACWLLMRKNRKGGGGGGDETGALRLASWVGLSQLGLWLFRSQLTPSVGTFGIFLIAVATTIFYAFVARTMYLALEPHVRRRWPQTMMSWSAVIMGHFKEPIVGRDILAGAALSVLVRIVSQVVTLILPITDPPSTGSSQVLIGLRSTIAVFFTSVPHGIRDTLLFFFILFILRVLLRNQWLASAGFALLFGLQNGLQSNHPWIDGIAGCIVFGLIAALVLRFGLLALAVFIFVDNVLSNVQATANISAWYFGNDLLLLASVLILAAWGFHTSLGGRRIWKADLLD
jgi:serine/threonine-protein kinase